MNTKKEKLIEQIHKGFKEVNSGTESGQKKWTRAFMNKLRDIGIVEGYKVYSSSCSEKIPESNGGGEWLFDLCWRIEGKEKNLKGLELICECEWKMNEAAIIYDFQKLAVAKAEIKIMIVQCKAVNEIKQIKKYCKESVSKSLRKDQSIYLVCSPNDGSPLSFDKLW